MTQAPWPGPRFAPSTRRGLLVVIAFVLLALAVAKFVVQSVFTFWGELPWMDEELRPLLALLGEGRPITQINFRQYGVVTFLLFDPFIRLFGSTFFVLNVGALITQIPSIVVAFVLFARRYLPRSIAAYAFLAAAWLSFTPTNLAVALRSVDSWQLLFISTALFLYTSDSRFRAFAGIPLAAGMLTRLLPGVVLAFVAFRSWRAGALALVAIAVLLSAGQLLYGWLMGFGYPFAILSAAPGGILGVSTQQENNSLRGLLFKVASGFRVDESTAGIVIPTSAPTLNLVAYAVSAALFAYLLWVGIRSGRRATRDRRSLEFCLAIVTMLLISPQAPYEYFMALLPVFSVLAVFWWRGVPVRWPRWLAGLALLAAVVVGVFLPIGFIARLIPVTQLMGLAGNDPYVYGGPTVGSYEFLGFPGLGALCAWLVLVVLERRMPSEPIGAEPRAPEQIPPFRTRHVRPIGRTMAG